MEPTINSINNKINNINNNENHCDIHKNEDLIVSCTQCKILICKLCLVYDHNGHKVDVIDYDKIISFKDLIKKTKEYQFDISGYKESDRHIMNAIEYCLNQTVMNERDNIDFINKNCIKVSNSIHSIAKNIIKIINTDQEINNDQYLSLYEEFKQNNDNYNTIINENNDILNSDLNDLLQDQIYNEIKIKENNNNAQQLIIKKKKREPIESFKINKITFNEQIYQQILELINEKLFTITKVDYKDNIKDNPYKQDLMINKYFNPFLCQYYICHGEPIPDDVFEVAYDSNYIHNKLNTPKHVNKISLFNGFKLPLLDHNSSSIIPNWINVLVIWNTVYPLIPNSIPKSVGELYIRNGYAHRITEGTIPNTVRELFIDNIKYPLVKGSIGDGVEILKIRNGYNHTLTEGVINSSISILYFGRLGDNNNNNNNDSNSSTTSTSSSTPITSSSTSTTTSTSIPILTNNNNNNPNPNPNPNPSTSTSIPILTNETIPKLSKLHTIHFLNDFNQIVPDNFIPKTCRSITLEFYSIDQIKLFKYGIPTHIKKIILHNHNNYKHLIDSSLINSSIKVDYL